MSQIVLTPNIPATKSWWLDAPRDGFYTVARAEQPRMLLSQAGQRKRPSAPDAATPHQVKPKWSAAR